VFDSLTVAEAMEVHVLHREALAGWGKRPQVGMPGMHEWAEMRARQGAMTEHLVTLSDLRIDSEMQVWKGSAPGLNDLAKAIQRTGTPKIDIELAAMYVNVLKSEKVRLLMESRGCRVLFLPSYSPDFSPIEETFSKRFCGERLLAHMKRLRKLSAKPCSPSRLRMRVVGSATAAMFPL
jgi:hypothetical protein